MAASSRSCCSVAAANGQSLRTVRPLMTNSDHANFAAGRHPGDPPGRGLRRSQRPSARRADARRHAGQGGARRAAPGDAAHRRAGRRRLQRRSGRSGEVAQSGIDRGWVDKAVADRRARRSSTSRSLPDQHQAVGAGDTALVFLQRETLADEMEDVALAGLGQPQESLAAEQSRRAAGIEERPGTGSPRTAGRSRRTARRSRHHADAHAMHA